MSATIAEYLSLARTLKENSSQADYRRANQLSWELAIMLPADLYRKMVQAIVNPLPNNNPLTVLIEARKYYLKDSDNLTTEDIAVHGPGIGKRTAQ